MSNTIVFDIGSCTARVGNALDDRPLFKFPTIVGHNEKDSDEIYIGNDILTRRANTENQIDIKWNCPIKNGFIENMDEMAQLYDYSFQKLNKNPEEHPVLLTEPVLNEKANREHIAQCMFETFNTPGLYIQMPGVLGMYASGSVNGITVDIGNEIQEIVPVYEGFPLREGINRVNFGGSRITDYFRRLCSEKGYYWKEQLEELEEVKQIKEKMCYVAENYKDELMKPMYSIHTEKTYELPDGKRFTLENQTFRATEILFDPKMDNIDEDGVVERLVSSIFKCPIDLRRNLYKNVVLTGGSSKFEGLKNRIHSEMKQMIPPTVESKIYRGDDAEIDVWIGGSILGSLDSFKKVVLNKETYEENGPSIVHRRFL